jgi:hypothetical protein
MVTICVVVVVVIVFGYESMKEQEKNRRLHLKTVINKMKGNISVSNTRDIL